MEQATITGGAIRQVRQAAGLSQTAAARLLGSDSAYLSKVETGKKLPSARWTEQAIRILADALPSKPQATDIPVEDAA